MKKFAWITLSAMALAACSNESANSATDTSSSQAETSQAQESETTKKQAESTKTDQKTPALPTITLEEAADVFVKEFPDAKLTSIDLEHDRSGWTYEMSGETEAEEYETEIDGQTGEIVRSENEGNDDNDTDQAIDFSQVISLKEAFQIAQENGLDKVESLNLDTDQTGDVIMEIEGENSDIELTLDAKSGEVLASVTD